MNRYLGALFLGVCLSSTALVGCGDDSAEDDGADGADGGGQKAELNETAAASAATLSASAVTQLNAGDGQSAAGSLYGVAGTALLMAVPTNAQPAAKVTVPDIKLGISSAAGLGIAASAACETACTGDGDTGSCDFTDCDTGGFSVEGHLEWGAGHFACDLTYGIAAAAEGQNITVDYHLVADVDYTPTSLDGTLSMDGSSSAGGSSSTFEVDVTYNALQFPEAGGCPTSGSISVAASISAGGQSYDAEGDVTFPVDGCVG